jgi:hypothetical protein
MIQKSPDTLIEDCNRILEIKAHTYPASYSSSSSFSSYSNNTETGSLKPQKLLPVYYSEGNYPVRFPCICKHCGETVNIHIKIHEKYCDMAL